MEEDPFNLNTVEVQRKFSDYLNETYWLNQTISGKIQFLLNSEEIDPSEVRSSNTGIQAKVRLTSSLK